uniref:coiled-coil domain-containing protein 150-like n=1 Tax=Monopterus albus TaxID=43700 RepID=UPI0009B36A8F|nr:coiled-coil domain-containing protein 150-like [Monopterus albus]
MSHSATLPPSVGATAPDTLSLLHQRLLLAEQEAEALIRDMGGLGVSRDQILGSAKMMDETQRPLRLLKNNQVQGDERMLWQQCNVLVSRVCCMESLLQTCKLSIFHLETERELDSSHIANLKQQLTAQKQKSEEEQRAYRREVVKLRNQLQQAYQERDDARTKVQRLLETMEESAAAKIDVALAAEELKIVKLEMSQKIKEMKEQMRQETSCSAEVMKSHTELLHRVAELERAVAMESRQGLLLQSEAQASRQQLKEEKDRNRQLESRCRLLKEQTAVKTSLASELEMELKRQQIENSKVLKEGRDIRTAAGRLQTLNKQLQSQCCQLSSALRALRVVNEQEQFEHQAKLQAERRQVVKQLQEQVLLLRAARRNTQTELQVALAEKVCLQKELEKLKGEHTRLLQSFSTARETAVTHKELLEQTIERLQVELRMAQKQEEAARKDLEASRNEISEVEALQGVSGFSGGVVSQTPENVLASRTRHRLSSQTLHQELGGQEQGLASLEEDRLQALRDIRSHQLEVEKLQQLLTSQSRNNRALESLQKGLEVAKADNSRLAQSLEQAVSTNSSLHSKLEQARDQYQATIALRDEELCDARTKISCLSEELGAVKQQHRENYESPVKTLHQQIAELKMAIKDSSTGSGDQFKANQELQHRVSELERLVSKQKARIKEQSRQLRQQQKSSSQKAEKLEESVRNVQGDVQLQEINSYLIIYSNSVALIQMSSENSRDVNTPIAQVQLPNQLLQ